MCSVSAVVDGCYYSSVGDRLTSDGTDDVAENVSKITVKKTSHDAATNARGATVEAVKQVEVRGRLGEI